MQEYRPGAPSPLPGRDPDAFWASNMSLRSGFLVAQANVSPNSNSLEVAQIVRAERTIRAPTAERNRNAETVTLTAAPIPVL